jgi:outer membrane protein
LRSKTIAVAVMTGLVWPMQPAWAQAVPNPGALLPDMVGPVDDRAGKAPFDPTLPADTPDEIRAIDLSTPVVTLQDALVRAYWFNPQLLAERASMRAADFGLPQARAAFGPSIDYSVGLNWQRDIIDSPLGGSFSRSGRTQTAAAILTQPIYTFGRLAANERSARARIAFERARLRDTEQQVLFAAISAYVGVLRDRAGLQIAKDNLDILEREASDVRARYAVREATEVDLQQVETQTAIARAEMTNAQATLDASTAAFGSAIGSPPGELAAPNPLILPASSLDSAQEVAEADNPIVAASRAREQASRAAADGAAAARLPRVDLQGRADFGTNTPYENDLRSNSYQAGIVLSGPIFDSGLLAARQKEAQAANDADWRLIDRSLRDLRAEVATAWSASQAASAAVGDLAAAVDSAAKAYEGALGQQKAGFRTTLDVLILARDLLDVRRGYNSNLADAYLTKARLLVALGAMDLSDLMPGTAVHDPARHLEKVDGMGELPWTPVLEALDGLGYGKADKVRPIRDPALAPQPEQAAPR